MWLAAALAGCIVHETVIDDPAPDGTLEVSWTVGAQGCDAAGVTDIVVEAGGESATFACDVGRGSFDLPPGRYEVVAEGLDADGQPRYEGSANADVTSEQTTNAHVVLSALSSALTITWYFDNGRLCSANGVSDIGATLFDDEDYVVDEIDAACDDGELEFRDLTAGSYAAVLVAHDGSGVPLFDGAVSVELDKGDRVVVEVELIEH